MEWPCRATCTAWLSEEILTKALMEWPCQATCKAWLSFAVLFVSVYPESWSSILYGFLRNYQIHKWSSSNSCCVGSACVHSQKLCLWLCQRLTPIPSASKPMVTMGVAQHCIGRCIPVRKCWITHVILGYITYYIIISSLISYLISYLMHIVFF